MFNTNNVKEFIKTNDSELRKMVTHICHRYHVFAIEDTLQDVYFRLLSKGVIERYDSDYTSGGSYKPQISTLIYTIVENMIRTQVKKNARIPKFIHFDSIEMSGNFDNIDFALQFDKVASDYDHIFDQHNPINNLRDELKDFEEKFLRGRANKKYAHRKRHCKKDTEVKITLMEVYKYLSLGLTNVEIASITGVTPMFISAIKKDVRKALKRYGIVWKTKKITRRRRSNDSNKMS